LANERGEKEEKISVNEDYFPLKDKEARNSARKAFTVGTQLEETILRTHGADDRLKLCVKRREM